MTTQPEQNLGSFWQRIDRQLAAVAAATSTAEVLAVCPQIEDVSSGDGFCASGSGSDFMDALCGDGRWRIVWADADYHWAAIAPNGDRLTYCEGDLYDGDSRAS